ncbi:MAG TPA: EAL domain-containing protein [Solirubrobacteraceae bacterium]|jgi:PAS domain S-box-containing protein|nr:EAL domain-containing protein [Solirubrobacteraceae bacterium]
MRPQERTELLATQDRLREAHEAARLSSWEWHPESNDVIVFQALASDIARSGARIDLDELLGAMSPADRSIAREDLAAMVAGSLDESTRRCCYELAEGQAWLETHSRALRDDTGGLLSVRGTTQEVTGQHLATQELLAARNYLSAVTDGMGEGLCTTDRDGRVVYVNDAAVELLGWNGSLAKGRVMHDLVHATRSNGSLCRADDCPILRASLDGIAVRVEDDEFSCRDGSILPVAYAAAPFVTDDGAQGCAIVFADATERKAREVSLERDAETLSWISRIQDALAEQRFELFAQPILDLHSGAVVQRELLLRLREPDGTIVPPIDYLPIAERYGLIADIDHWVIEQACEIAAEIGPVQLNLSARSIGDPAIVAQIEQCLTRSRADPASLVFEITETALIADECAAKAFAERLHRLGCKLALDDFGTGYGGFTYLKQLPVDMLKIDIEFVRDLGTSAASRHVVVAVVALARAFGLKTVAEGVEDAHALRMVRELGVDFAQGFQIGRPAPIVEHSPRHPEPGLESQSGLLSQTNGSKP